MAAALPFSTSKVESLFPSEIFSSETRPLQTFRIRPEASHKSKELLEITGIFRGRKLIRKERRLSCGIAPIDNLIGGGIVRGRVSEIIGNSGAGKTTLAAAFVASVTARGEIAAWIDASGSFDPASIAAAGVDLARMLWVATPSDRSWPDSRIVDEVEHDCPGSLPAATAFERERSGSPRSEFRSNYAFKRSTSTIVLKVANGFSQSVDLAW
jgi:hypothetical protein